MIRKFFIRSFLYSIPFLLLIGFFEFRLNRFDNSYKQKDRNFQKQAANTEVLVLGNSQAFFGINPEYFSHPGFNYANVSQSLYYDKTIALEELKQMPKLKVVIISLSYFSFYYDLADSPEYWRGYYYSRFQGIRSPELSPFDLRHYSLFALYSPTKSVEYCMDGYKNNFSGMLANGFVAKPNTSDQKFNSDAFGKKRVSLHEESFKTKRYEEVTADFEELVSKLHTAGIEVVLVTPPVLPSYSRFCKPEILASNTKFIEGICKKYNCTYSDYFTDTRFGPEDFYNSDHLNGKGAEHFSRVLNEEVLGKVFGGK